MISRKITLDYAKDGNTITTWDYYGRTSGVEYKWKEMLTAQSIVKMMFMVVIVQPRPCGLKGNPSSSPSGGSVHVGALL